MNLLSKGIVAGFFVFLILLVGTTAGVRAHLQEDFVDWDIGYANVNFLGPPVITEMDTVGTPTTVMEIDAQGDFPVIEMSTGDRLRIDYSFISTAEIRHRGALFWITRLGLDFGTLGQYVDGVWIAGNSFAFDPGVTYNATMVIRAIQPVQRHLHVGLSINDVGNIPAAPTVDPIPEGGPVLYGVFTDASGPVTEPVDPNDVGGLDVPLLAPWPWATAGFIAQIVLGLGFIAFMFWYGRRLKAKGGG